MKERSVVSPYHQLSWPHQRFEHSYSLMWCWWCSLIFTAMMNQVNIIVLIRKHVWSSKLPLSENREDIFFFFFLKVCFLFRSFSLYTHFSTPLISINQSNLQTMNIYIIPYWNDIFVEDMVKKNKNETKCQIFRQCISDFFAWILFSLVQGFSHTAVKQCNMCPPQKKKTNKKKQVS